MNAIVMKGAWQETRTHIGRVLKRFGVYAVVSIVVCTTILVVKANTASPLEKIEHRAEMRSIDG